MPHCRSKYRPDQIEAKRRTELIAILKRIKDKMIPEPSNRIAQFRNERNRATAFMELKIILRKMQTSDHQIYPVLTLIEKHLPSKMLVGEEGLLIEAMIADLVAPWLSGSARGSVNHRYYFAKEIPQNQC